MKKFFTTIILYFFVQTTFAQKIYFSIYPEGKIIYHEIENKPLKKTVEAIWSEELYVLKINIKTPSEFQIGKFDEMILTTYGKDVFRYNIDKEEVFGKSDVYAIYHTKCDVIRTVSVLDAGGFIEITKSENNKVSGTFEAKLNGTGIRGYFDDIEIKIQ